MTPAATGPVLLEIENWRAGNYDDPVMDYVDDIKVLPAAPSFAGDTHEFPVLAGGTDHLTLEAGTVHAGKSYLVFSGLSGTWPGFTLSGVHVPLNLDGWTWIALTLANTPVMQQFMGTLDAQGNASATFHAPGPLPIESIGLVFWFTFVVTDNPGAPPVSFASNPLYVLVIP